MAKKSTTGIDRLIERSPRRNFPAKSARKRNESSFVLSFARLLGKSGETPFDALVREFPLNGYGIADLVTLKFLQDNITSDATPRKAVLQAFEMKMCDWRRAMAQAFRYRYFADRSVVVLPPKEATSARGYLDTFRQLGIGLWSFDRDKAAVVEYYTPPLYPPLNESAKRKAISVLRTELNLSKSSE